MKETKKDLDSLKKDLELMYPGFNKQYESKKKGFLRDKEGNRLTVTEYIARWKKGIEGITPAQSIQTQIGGTRIILIGLCLGLVMSLVGFKSLWWVSIILCGAIVNTSIQYLGLVKQRNVYRDIEQRFKDPEELDLLNADLIEGGNNGYK